MRTLKIARTERRMSQQDLTSLTGIFQTAISNIERGIVTPSEEQKTIFEKILGPIDWSDKENPPEEEIVDLHLAMDKSFQQIGVLMTLRNLGKITDYQELRSWVNSTLKEE